MLSDKLIETLETKEKDNKVGRNGYQPYDIPIEYDELIELSSKNADIDSEIYYSFIVKFCVAYIRLGKKWGFYSTMFKDIDGWRDELIQGNVEPLFDSVKLVSAIKIPNSYPNKFFHELLFSFTIGNKVGLIYGISNRVVVPPVFDEITDFKLDDKNNIICYGIIEGMQTIYDGNRFIRGEYIEPKTSTMDSETYKKLVLANRNIS